MMGLISVGPRSSASASWASDHDDQRGSSVKMSSRTLESTSVPAVGPTSAFIAGERHDLLGGHGDVPAAAHALDDRRPAPAPGADQPRTALVELELHLRAGLDAEPPPHGQGDGDLSLARHAHERTLALGITSWYYIHSVIFGRVDFGYLDPQCYAGVVPPLANSAT